MYKDVNKKAGSWTECLLKGRKPFSMKGMCLPF